MLCSHITNIWFLFRYKYFIQNSLDFNFLKEMLSCYWVDLGGLLKTRAATLADWGNSTWIGWHLGSCSYFYGLVTAWLDIFQAAFSIQLCLFEGWGNQPLVMPGSFVSRRWRKGHPLALCKHDTGLSSHWALI